MFFVGLTQTPVDGTVAVTRDGTLLTSGTDFTVLGSKVLFLDATGDPLAVTGAISVSYQYVTRGFETSFTTPVLAHISDADAPTVLVRQTEGSTDVIEVKKGGAAPESIPAAFNTDTTPWSDSYELVLTGVPTADVTVTVVYDSPGHAGSRAYELLWQKQAGREADPISLRISLPPGSTMRSESLGSKTLSGDSVTTDLRVDRDFAFTY